MPRARWEYSECGRGNERCGREGTRACVCVTNDGDGPCGVSAASSVMVGDRALDGRVARLTAFTAAPRRIVLTKRAANVINRSTAAVDRITAPIVCGSAFV